jgi:hypothetical protein
MSRTSGLQCANPIDAALLADYWLALLPKPEEDAIEEHLFSCDECGARLREIVALAFGVRQIAREGSLLMVVSDEFLKRAEEDGLRIRDYAPIPPGGRVECTISADDDLLIGRVAADFTPARRVDLCAYIRGEEQFRLADIPVPAGAGVVTFQISSTYAKASASNTMIMRLIGYDEADAEHLLGEYTFNHTRTIPGPAAW